MVLTDVLLDMLFQVPTIILVVIGMVTADTRWREVEATMTSLEKIMDRFESSDANPSS